MSIDFNYNDEILNKFCYYEKILTYTENISPYYAFMNLYMHKNSMRFRAFVCGTAYTMNNISD